MELSTRMESALARRELLWLGACAGLGAALMPRLALAAAEPDLMPHVRAVFERWVGPGKFPGMIATLGLPGRDAQFLTRGSEGFTDADAMSPDSLFRIYSMTKPITGMAAMMLVEDGKLGLDQPVADILPRFSRMQVQVTPDGSITDVRPAKAPITVRNLLTHTAGLGYSIIQRGPLRNAYNEAGLSAGRVSRLPVPGFDRSPSVESLALFADRLADMPLVYEPGTKWSYSVGLDLLGRIIEVVTGQSFDTFLKRRLFEPAGMTSSWFQVPQSAAGRLTTNYGAAGSLMAPIDEGKTSIYLEHPPCCFGGSGLVSSPRDYDRFLRMLAQYGRIGKQRVMGELAVRVGTGNLLPDGVDGPSMMAPKSLFGAGGRDGWHGRYARGHPLGHIRAVHAADRQFAAARICQGAARGYHGIGGQGMSASTVAFVGSQLDRADHVRQSPDALTGLMNWQARLLRLDGLDPVVSDEGMLSWGTLADADPEAELVFLGLNGGHGCFAAVPLAGSVAPPNPRLWQAVATLAAGELATYGGARSMVDWHARHRFCARCGSPTSLTKGGWQRNCMSDTCNAEHFPRVDPVTIMLVEHNDSILLGRQPRFPEGNYSALAGFVEPGETIEEAVAREVQEEAGVVVRDVSYVMSQPWPFPSSLMIGCHAHADDPAVTVDKNELEDARWFTRAEVTEAMAAVQRGDRGEAFGAPPKMAVAHHLLNWWVERG